MRLPYLRILFELICFVLIASIGIGSGYLASQYSIHYLIKNAGFLDSMFIHTIINEHGYYEMTQPTIGDNQ